MKKTLAILLLIITLSNCKVEKKKDICGCCKKSYTNIDSAIVCADKEDQELLWVVIRDNFDSKSKLGWKILNDKDILEAAQSDYVLLLVTKEQLLKRGTPELIKEYKREEQSELVFVLTFTDLTPFSSWNQNADKEFIIDRLGVGIGP